MRRFLLLAIALSLASSCTDAMAASTNGSCALVLKHPVAASYFPDGTTVDAFDAIVKETVERCPIASGSSYRAFVHGDSITYSIVWP